MKKEFSPIPEKVDESIKIGDFIVYKGDLSIVTNDNGSTNNYMIVSLSDGEVLRECYTISELQGLENVKTFPEATAKIQIELPKTTTGFGF